MFELGMQGFGLGWKNPREKKWELNFDFVAKRKRVGLRGDPWERETEEERGENIP